MDLVVARELDVLGSHGMPAVDYPAMLDLVTSGALDPDRLVTRRIGLEDAGAALAAMDHGRRRHHAGRAVSPAAARGVVCCGGCQGDHFSTRPR